MSTPETDQFKEKQSNSRSTMSSSNDTMQPAKIHSKPLESIEIKAKTKSLHEQPLMGREYPRQKIRSGDDYPNETPLNENTRDKKFRVSARKKGEHRISKREKQRKSGTRSRNGRVRPGSRQKGKIESYRPPEEKQQEQNIFSRVFFLVFVLLVTWMVLSTSRNKVSSYRRYRAQSMP